MKTIKFRGKSKESNEWVYGFYYEVPAPLKCIGKQDDPKGYIIMKNPNVVNDWGMPIPVVGVEVDKETVCQYTGFDDTKNKEIYKGDILHVIKVNICGVDKYNVAEYNTDVKWEDGAFVIKGNADASYYDTWIAAYDNPDSPQIEIEVIGNIYENPELLYEL